MRTSEIEPVLVDAFVGEGAQGNPAAVIVCGTFPDTAEMQAAAHEISAPATAFLLDKESRGAHPVRWFGPDREITLCGHGALAAAHVLLSRLDSDGLSLRTGVGRELRIHRKSCGRTYELALPAIGVEPRDWPALVDVLGAQPAEVSWNDAGYALARFENVEQVRALSPDFEALAALGNIQVSATAPGGPQADFTSRVFSAGREDAATGSAHAMLAPYWCQRLGVSHLFAFQASARGGRFACRVGRDQVWLGGECRAAT